MNKKNMHIHSYYTSSMDVSWCIHSYSSWHPFKQICPIFVKQHVDILMCNSVEQWWRLEPIPAWKKYPLMATQRVETYVIAILNHFSRVLISRFYLLGRLLSVNPHPFRWRLQGSIDVLKKAMQSEFPVRGLLTWARLGENVPNDDKKTKQLVW